MWLQCDEVRIQLRHGEHLRLKDASGAQVIAVEGTAWITVEREPGDVLVAAGDRFLVPSDRSVLVGALFGALTLSLAGTPRTIAETVSLPCPQTQSRQSLAESGLSGVKLVNTHVETSF